MEIPTTAIEIEELDALARLLLPDITFDNCPEPGLAAALAIEAGKLSLGGQLREIPAFKNVRLLAAAAIKPAA